MASNSMTIEKWGTRCNEDDNDNDDYHDNNNNNTPHLCPGAGNARQFFDRHLWVHQKNLAAQHNHNHHQDDDDEETNK